MNKSTRKSFNKMKSTRRVLTSIANMQNLRKVHLESKPRVDGPFKVFKRIGNNSYKIELPDHYNVSSTFNVSDFSLFHCEYNQPDSTSSLFQQGEIDIGVYANKLLILGPKEF